MIQQYTPVAWQDETTSQQGTLINAERLNQMQTAHHYADGFEEVDAVPTADPSVPYHKVVYCTADNTFYRWGGTEWTKDIDDETKRLLQQEIARATEAEGELAQDLADETTARETADTAMQADITAMQSGKLDKKTTGPLQYQIYGVRGSNQIMFDTWGTGHSKVPTYGIEEDLLAKMPTISLTENTVVNYGWATAQIGAEATARAEADTALGGRIDTEQARAEAAEQANAQAIANTYTKAETDTLLAGKADTSTVQTLDTRVGALETGLADTYSKSQTDTLLAGKADASNAVTTDTPQTITGFKTISRSGEGLRISNPTFTLKPDTGEAITDLDLRDASGNQLTALMDYRRSGTNPTHISIIRHRTEAGNTVDFRLYDNYMTGPSRGYNAGSVYSSDVATIATLDAYTPMVRTTGDQTIAGNKTFNRAIIGCAAGKHLGACGPNGPNVGNVYLMATIDNLPNNEGAVFRIVGGLNNANYVYAMYRVYKISSTVLIQCIYKSYSSAYQKPTLYIYDNNGTIEIYGTSMSWCVPQLFFDYWENGGLMYQDLARHTMTASTDFSTVTLPTGAIAETGLLTEM